MAAEITSLNAGDTIACTINKVPNNKAARDTICRLMRRDPEVKRGLKRAQKLRADRMNVYVRGNRWWSSREKAAQIVRCEQGNAWSFTYTPDIAADLASVEPYLGIEKA